MTPLEVVQATSLPLNDVGAAVYFHADTRARGKELGLDGFTFYFLGRGGVLGDCESVVVSSAFGYFHPDVVAKMWNRGRAIVPPRDAARELLACGHRIGETTLAEVDPETLAAFTDAAATWRRNQSVAGLPLYAGIDAEPMPDDLGVAATAFHHALVLRELRGGIHLLAVTASGLNDGKAHAIRRPQDREAFGWPEPFDITSADTEALARADVLSDELMVPAAASLSGEQAEAIVAGAAAMQAAFANSNRFANRTE